MDDRRIYSLVFHRGVIKNIDRDTFQMKNLGRICLRNNSLYSHGLPVGVFRGVNNLVVLSVKHMNINFFLRGLLDDLTKLEYLNFSYNNIRLIKANVFKYLKKLTVLILSNNNIKRIYELAFSSLTSLKELILCTNKLSLINVEIVDGLKSLELLNLNHNQINHIGSGTLSYLVSLKRLYLKQNKLVSIGETDFHSVIGLDIFTVGDNPIVCDCTLFWLSKLTFVKVQKLKYDHVQLRRQIVCYDSKVALFSSIYNLTKCKQGYL